MLCANAFKKVTYCLSDIVIKIHVKVNSLFLHDFLFSGAYSADVRCVLRIFIERKSRAAYFAQNKEKTAVTEVCPRQRQNEYFFNFFVYIYISRRAPSTSLPPSSSGRASNPPRKASSSTASLKQNRSPHACPIWFASFFSGSGISFFTSSRQ